MRLKGLAKLAALLAISLATNALAAKPGDRTGASPRTSSISTVSTSNSQNAGTPRSAIDDPGGVPDTLPPPHISIATPAPMTMEWSFHEKIAWAANLVLVALGYAGIMLAISLLKKIERQTTYAEAAAEAAATSAHAALLNAQAIIDAERPWILITIEPSRSAENSFTIMATNRGRTPAKILVSEERTRIIVDERHLPSPPEYRRENTNAPLAPTILLPGEFMAIKPFGRNEVKGLCDSEERYKRIETWEEKIYHYGRITYKDLISPADSPAHETNWCCWYIHGRQSSGMVMAGPPEYNSHT
jgi:hypothetical protein